MVSVSGACKVLTDFFCFREHVRIRNVIGFFISVFSVSYICSERALGWQLAAGFALAGLLFLLKLMDKRKVSMSTSVGALQAV